MEIKEVKDRSQWNKLVTAFKDYTFLQSWEWGEINDVGEKVWRIKVEDGGRVVAVAQGFVIGARRGRMMFVPHGPLFSDRRAVKKVVDYFRLKAIEEDCVCLRVCPWLVDNRENRALFEQIGFRQTKVVMHAIDTWLVDLTGSEEELLSRMRKTTRNLIKRGIRDGVKITKSADIGKVDSLYELQMEVVKRNNFVPFSKKYLERELVELTKDGRALLFLGESVNEGLVGAALIVFLGKYAFYYQSGSRESKTPVNYVLQWEVMKEAKMRGCEVYNMWGVAPEGSGRKHPWAGLTLFKMGFGGELRKYMKTQDLPISWKYWLMVLVEMIPKKWRSILTKS